MFDVVMDHTTTPLATSPLTSGDVAALYGVTTTTVKRWAASGALEFFKTPGGHYRFTYAAVAKMRAAAELTGSHGAA